MSNKGHKCSPAWFVTFADMMTLIMCFFVLMLSMANQDAKKFKLMSGSLVKAFGVKNPDSKVMPPQTINSEPVNEPINGISLEAQQMQEKLVAVITQVARIQSDFQTEIDEGIVSIEHVGLKIVIRINEKGSFASGVAELNPGFDAVMLKIAHTVQSINGQVIIAGHTDNVPITASAYRSNWALSSMRAVTVAQFILEKSRIDAARVVIEAHADTQPLVPNDSIENRAKNRRVEIRLLQDDTMQTPVAP